MPKEAQDLSNLQYELEAMEAGDQRQVSIDSHAFTVSAVGEFDQPRHRIECTTCDEIVNVATTLAVAKMECHIREYQAAKLPPPDLKPSDDYFILSLKGTRGDMLCWWRANNNGYTCRLDDAGRYPRDHVTSALSYYHNGTDTLAIPCADVEAAAIRFVPGEAALLAEFTKRRFRMRTDRDDNDDSCSACGEYPHATNLGLQVTGASE